MTEQASVDIWNFIHTPSIAFRLYVYFTLVALGVALRHLIWSWVKVRPFSEVPLDSRERAISFLNGLALSLKRWMVANCFAWALVTTQSLRSGLFGLAQEVSVSSPLVNIVLYELTEPMIIALWILAILYGIRWHFLYRAEHLSRM
jgi:hypothetical protein